MKFAIITQATHKRDQSSLFAYEPYVREMNLWLEHYKEVKIIAPFSSASPTKVETSYKSEGLLFIPVQSFDILSFSGILKTIITVPEICIQIVKLMRWADHIHLRCPGNMGLLGCFLQLFFPKKPKTVKYAGNWDPESKQPWSYKLQKWILNNTFITKNCKVLIYGEWPNLSKNIHPFFTASYSKNEIIPIASKSLSKTIQLIFVGGFTEGKQPLLSVKVAQQLLLKNYNIELNMYGEGVLFEETNDYIKKHKLSKHIYLHGNQPKEVVKQAYQKSHFLVFVSKSEGWPKVVAEAMFWSCLPISSKVSCVPYMLGYGKRGAVVSGNINEIVQVIESYIKNEKNYEVAVLSAKEWSQEYTLEKFNSEIKQFL